MTTALSDSFFNWTPGEDYPYVMRLADHRVVALTIPAAWVLLDKTGEICLRPPAVRWLDKLRALFSRIHRAPTPGFIRTLRQAMSLTQDQFGRQLGVNKMTVSRWERGTIRPGTQAVKALVIARAEALHRGLLIEAEAPRERLAHMRIQKL
jgi:DNA-binding XRE family transcriptional regulator